jgi:two-component system nitrate/nitrite response regulator NarL
MTTAIETSNTRNTWAQMFPSTGSRVVPEPQAQDGQGKKGSAAREEASLPRREKPPVVAHPYGLTDAEMAVLEILAEGASNEEIARGRSCAVGTVKVHLGRIFRKLSVRNRGEAIVIARRLKAIQQALLERARGTPFQLNWILQDMTDEQHPAGTVLFRMDDQADALYFIQSGRIALPEVKAYLAEGSVFGEIGIFAEDHRRTSSAVCETPVRLFRVSAERVWDLYAENPSFAVHLLRLAASRIMGERLRFRLPPL